MTSAELQEYLYALEERLLHPDREPDRSVLAPLFADNYREFCCSGRILDRQQTIELLLNSSARPATITFFNITLLAPDVALATYHAATNAARSHRSSLWIYRDQRWQIQFHQGTMAD